MAALLAGLPVEVAGLTVNRLCGSGLQAINTAAHAIQVGDGDVFVPDLAGRASIFDKEMKLVTHLGDNSDPKLRAEFNVPKDKWKDGEFTAPHGGTWDHDGNLYVMDWNSLGRVTKLQRLGS